MRRKAKGSKGPKGPAVARRVTVFGATGQRGEGPTQGRGIMLWKEGERGPCKQQEGACGAKLQKEISKKIPNLCLNVA